MMEYVDGLRDRACGRVVRAHRGGRVRGVPIESAREYLLRDARGYEQRYAAAYAPLGHDLVHEEHQVRADEQLHDYECPGYALAVPSEQRGHAVRELGRRLHEAVHLGHRLDQYHDEHQELLGALVDRLVLLVLEVELDDLRAREELHDDGPGDDRAYAQVHQRELRARKY